MVSETLARRLWPGESAVGRQLVVDYSTAGTYPYEIVGVVGDLRFRGPRSAPRPGDLPAACAAPVPDPERGHQGRGRSRALMPSGAGRR